MKTFFTKLLASFALYQQRRANFWLLTHLSDHNLKDMGITRGEIRQKIYGNKS